MEGLQTEPEEDLHEARVRGLLRRVLGMVVLLSSGYSAVALLSSKPRNTVAVPLALFGVALAALGAMRKVRPTRVALAGIVAMMGLYFWGPYQNGGVRAPGATGLLCVLFFAAWLLPRRTSALLGTVALAWPAAWWWLEAHGLLPAPRSVHDTSFYAGSQLCYIGAVTGFLYDATGGVERLIEQVRHHAQERTDAAHREARMQEALREAQRVEGLSRLAADVAHDLNNLLAVVQGNADALRASDLDAEGQQQLAAIRRAVERGRDVSAYALRTASERPSPTHVQPVTTTVLQLRAHLETLAGPKITLRLDIDDETPSVSIDPVQLTRLLVNLVQNARQAMPDGGTLRVGVGAGSDGSGAPAVVITVSDEGVGMTPEVLARATEAFFTTRDGASGLGLAIAKTVALEAGGSLELQSALGEGTTVRAILPRSPTPMRGAPAIVPASLPPGRVLVVDDEDAVRAVIARILRGAGFGVVEASSMTEALAVPPDSYDVVVTDVLMPGGSGPALVAALRARREALPVLFVSGYTGPEQQALASQGALLAKPFTARDLVDRVRELGRGPRQAEPALEMASAR